jgi:hypothetical protein
MAGGEITGADADNAAGGSGGIAAMAGECHAEGRIAAAPATTTTATPVKTMILVFTKSSFVRTSQPDAVKVMNVA